jgi:LPXTG-motif cell wall-anchored protein
MSGLSMRTRIITVAVSGAIVAPFALMGGSAHAVDAPIVGDVTNVDGLLGGDLLGGVLGTATGTAGLDPVSTVTGTAADPLSVVETLPLGDVLGGDVLDTVTNLVDLENVLETVTNLVDLDGIIKTVTDLVGSVTDTLNLDDLLSLPVKVNKPAGEVKGAAKPAATKKAAKETVSAGSLPQTGGNADLTAMLLCAGLAVAGTGVTLVTRRRNSILGAA